MTSRKPSPGATARFAGAPGIGGGGAVYGPAADEFRHLLLPYSFIARTPTMYVFALSTPVMSMSVVVCP